MIGDISKSMGKKKQEVHLCFWCEKKISGKEVTKDHLMPLGMGGKDGKTVPSCRHCNEERGRVTEIYSDRIHMIQNIQKRPERITSYKNRFCKKVRKMSATIIKWELLHRQKGIILPYYLLQVISLDHIMPL